MQKRITEVTRSRFENQPKALIPGLYSVIDCQRILRKELDAIVKSEVSASNPKNDFHIRQKKPQAEAQSLYNPPRWRYNEHRKGAAR